MKMSDGIITAVDKVRDLLIEYPQTRDSDKLLWLAYMAKYHGLKLALGDEKYAELKNILLSEETPTMESVTRARRKIQETTPFLRGINRPVRMREEKVIRNLFQGEENGNNPR